jgi:methylmalonyl-CoA mutase N-terminal domain/subunit
MLQAIENQYFLSIIGKSYHQYLQAVEKGEKVIVGYNKYRHDGDELTVDVFEIDEEIEAKQVRRLEEVKARRDSQAAVAALEKLADVSAKGENVMEAAIRAAECYATHGEIIQAICRPRESYSEQFRLMSSKI